MIKNLISSKIMDYGEKDIEPCVNLEAANDVKIHEQLIIDILCHFDVTF